MDHERTSELLRPFAAGELSASESTALRAHLDSCEQCRAELTVVQRLIAPEDGLSEQESRSLRAAVLGAIATPEPVRTADVVPIRARGWRLAQALGVAAILVIGAVMVANLFDGFGGADGASTAGMDAAEESGAVADIQDSLSFRKDRARVRDVAGSTLDSAPLEAQAEQPEGGDADTGGASGAGGSGYKANKSRPAPVRPLYVRGAGRLNDRRLTLIGRFGLPLVLFPQAFTGADALDMQEDFLVQLANAAETDERADQVIECGAQVISRPDPVLPALATFGKLEGDQVFVLALAWSDTTDGPLDHYMVWVWPALDCEALPTYRAGSIGK